MLKTGIIGKPVNMDTSIYLYSGFMRNSQPRGSIRNPENPGVYISGGFRRNTQRECNSKPKIIVLS